MEPAPAQLSAQDALDHVAEPPLDVRSHEIERKLRRLALRQLHPDHLVADLWTVSVGEDDLVSRGIEVDHALQAALEVGIVLLDRAFFARAGNGIASQRDHGTTAMSLYGHGLTPARNAYV